MSKKESGKERIKYTIKYAGRQMIRNTISVLNLFPVRKNRVMFYSFNGKQYSCNPRQISEYLVREHGPELEVIWALKEPDKFKEMIPQEVKRVKYRSLKYYYLAKTSRVIVYNVQGFGELARREGQTFIQTWHASNGYKRLGDYVGMRKKLNLLSHKDYSYVMSGAENMTRNRVRGSMGFDGPVIPGTPRMDMLINKDCPNLIEKVHNVLGVPEEKKILLYAPTWRKDRDQNDYGLDYFGLKASLEKRFGGEWVIAVRLHPNVKTRIQTDCPYVVDATDYEDMQELLYVVDGLISDYSSCIWDYSFTGNPCMLYCADIEKYKEDKSFDIPISQWGFSISTNMEELCDTIESFDEEAFREAMEKHHKDMGVLEDGKATERVGSMIMKICGIEEN